MSDDFRFDEPWAEVGNITGQRLFETLNTMLDNGAKRGELAQLCLAAAAVMGIQDGVQGHHFGLLALSVYGGLLDGYQEAEAKPTLLLVPGRDDK